MGFFEDFLQGAARTGADIYAERAKQQKASEKDALERQKRILDNFNGEVMFEKYKEERDAMRNKKQAEDLIGKPIPDAFSSSPVTTQQMPASSTQPATTAPVTPVTQAPNAPVSDAEMEKTLRGNMWSPAENIPNQDIAQPSPQPVVTPSLPSLADYVAEESRRNPTGNAEFNYKRAKDRYDADLANKKEAIKATADRNEKFPDSSGQLTDLQQTAIDEGLPEPKITARAYNGKTAIENQKDEFYKQVDSKGLDTGIADAEALRDTYKNVLNIPVDSYTGVLTAVPGVDLWNRLTDSNYEQLASNSLELKAAYASKFKPFSNSDATMVEKGTPGIGLSGSANTKIAMKKVMETERALDYMTNLRAFGQRGMGDAETFRSAWTKYIDSVPAFVNNAKGEVIPNPEYVDFRTYNKAERAGNLKEVMQQRAAETAQTQYEKGTGKGPVGSLSDEIDQLINGGF